MKQLIKKYLREALTNEKNPWAICTASVGRDDKDKYEDCVQSVKKDEGLNEAEYQGRTVELNKPMKGDVKKYKVYVKNDKGNVVKVNFGDKNMEIKRDDPERRKSFRARHKCDNPGPKWKARYWSCKFWSNTPVSDLLGENADENPCWDGYEIVGMKKQDGKEVPNCVPKNKKTLDEKLELKNWDNYIVLVANTYKELPDYDSSVVHHWNALNKSNHMLFKRLLSKVNVVFTSNNTSKVGNIIIDGRKFKIVHKTQEEEYQTQSEMKQSFEKTGILYISIDHSDHPVFSVEDNIVFRTVHDYMAHILGNHDFGAKGEIASYNRHAKMAPKEAIPALFTEVVGQASATIVTNSFPKQKIAVMDGFDFVNLGNVDDANYEIVNKILVKKGETPEETDKNNRTEPTAIFQQED